MSDDEMYGEDLFDPELTADEREKLMLLDAFLARASAQAMATLRRDRSPETIELNLQLLKWNAVGWRPDWWDEVAGDDS